NARRLPVKRFRRGGRQPVRPPARSGEASLPAPVELTHCPRANARTIIEMFGHCVRVNRLRRGLSQRQLAARAHMRKKFIGEIERGTSNPSLESMVLVADALGCELAELLPSGDTLRTAAFKADELCKAHNALAVLTSILKPLACQLDDNGTAYPDELPEVRRRDGESARLDSARGWDCRGGADTRALSLRSLGTASFR
ncbi:MAG TPA: helix-turn-helix transcriptional regulator, partial [Vicinamibacterales bacterium]